MTQQWLRQCKLTMGDGSGNSIDMSELRIRFTIEMSDGQNPNTANIIVTNLSRDTISKIQKEYTTVTLEAGYQSGYGLIFKGEVVQKRSGRESPTDTFLAIVARDSDKSYNHAVTNLSLAAGHTYRDQVDAALAPMKSMGVNVGYIADLGSKKMPSARVLFGMSRDILNTVATSTGTSWSIQNGTFQMVKNDEPLPGSTWELTPATGLIGMPVQTIDGVEGRALLNSQFRIGTRVHINTDDIVAAAKGPLVQDELAYQSTPPLSSSGLYKLVYIRFLGDTRGQDWYADFIGVNADPGGRISVSVASRGIAIPD